MFKLKKDKIMPNRRPTTLERRIARLVNTYGQAAVLGFARGSSLGGGAVLAGASISAIANHIFSAINANTADKQMKAVVELERKCLSLKGINGQTIITECSDSQGRNRASELRSNAQKSRKRRDRAVEKAIGGGIAMFSGKVGEYRKGIPKRRISYL